MKAYCIQEPNGKTLRVDTVRSQRKDCIYDFVHLENETKWKDWYKYGWRCIKVDVHPMDQLRKFNTSKQNLPMAG